MFLDSYKEKGFLFNVNLVGTTGAAEVYRGDLVLEFGEVTERGDRKPPISVAKQAVLLVVDDKIQLIAAGLDRLSDLALIAENYGSDYAENCLTLFFVHNIKKPLVVSLNGVSYVAEPLDDGMIWNEILELLCIEKGDLKGQSAEEKVVTVSKELKSFKSKGEAVDFDTALGFEIGVKASARGPV